VVALQSHQTLQLLRAAFHHRRRPADRGAQGGPVMAVKQATVGIINAQRFASFGAARP